MPDGCHPVRRADQFGCNETGYLQINPVSGIAPASPWPLAATSTVNSAFPATFQSPMSEVVHHVPPGNHIPAAL